MTPVEQLLSLLDLEELEVNIFRGRSPQEERQRVFGGQVAGQALVAAYRTVEDRVVHSLHAYFLRAGDVRVPIVYQVERIRDGAGFSTRRVVAIQRGRAIFHLSASFQKPEDGPVHSEPMPDAPDPESLPAWTSWMESRIDPRMLDVVKAWSQRPRPILVRYVEPEPPTAHAPRQLVWVKADGPLPDSLVVHQCVAAYASDLTLLDTASWSHGIVWADPRYQIASLDHAMWFHRPFRADEWLLYAQESPSASGARGFATGRFYTRDGRLVVSVAQEGLLRPLGRDSGQE